ncbi:PQQ-dependent catabolism-associated CXXCW motif protein [Labrys sp. ZIDIC5]|uniref:PQQ-dependent catabolism-associated CXXCW motif protein n=1 Tax=Labrys sedimenti TaxID=3106036 RepID=UPI002ACAE895|nr:PQQ-dependent catabolism-associated CXXCW motif protein [Labrys sp. ZIDIC5]MDZ5452303.1 PQQ-dependent catabolism-associated CXXCW motif protein [Labrys sp. ZIDIC5]
MIRPIARSAVLLVLALATLPAQAGPPPEPSGYRLDDYRAPTPATLAGATVLDTARAEALWKQREALFVDVLPHPPKPAELPAGTLWRDPPHETIVGAVWLPEVGRGALAAATEDYFKRSLAELTHGRREEALVFFCKKDCWMSWNAAKRAVSYGYGRVYWYADGVDGWKGAGLALETVKPRP